jgi:hypothetical protein
VSLLHPHETSQTLVPSRAADGGINYYNLAMGNVTDGPILTFGIRSQNSTEIERRQRAATRDRPAQNREPTDNRHYAQQTTSRHSDNLIPIPSLADQPYNTKETDKKA